MKRPATAKQWDRRLRALDRLHERRLRREAAIANWLIAAIAVVVFGWLAASGG